MYWSVIFWGRKSETLQLIFYQDGWQAEWPSTWSVQELKINTERVKPLASNYAAGTTSLQPFSTFQISLILKDGTKKFNFFGNSYYIPVLPAQPVKIPAVHQRWWLLNGGIASDS